MSSSLWRERDFLKLWSAQTLSQVGTQFTLIALPLTAILVLDASTFAVAALAAMDTIPFLLFALPAGVWVDRLRRRPLMIAADVGRAAALASIPIAYAFGVLSLAQLFVVGFVTGALAVMFDVAYLSFLPGLVGRRRIAGGNARLEATNSAAQAAGPGVAGGLVGLVGAPFAIIADAVSYAVSAVLLARIRHVEQLAPPAERRAVVTEIREGVRYVFRQPYLRVLTLSIGASNFFQFMVLGVFMVYLVRELGLAPEVIGLVFTTANLGALAGAIVNGRVVRRCGLGRTIVGSALLASIAWIVVPLAPQGNPLPLLVAGALAGPFFGTMFNVNQLTLRQAITPERLLGRMNAVVRFMYWGPMSLGSLAGGAAATVIGLRPTLFAGVTGATLAFVPLAATQLARLRSIPEHPDEWVPTFAPPVAAPATAES